MRPSTCFALLALTACGGASAAQPLAIPMGLDRAGTTAELRRIEFCPENREGEPAAVSLYPRCDVAGAEYGQAWVVGHFDGGGRLTRLQRFERHSDPERGTERFNSLIEQLNKAHGAPDPAIKQQLATRFQPPPGVKTWVAFAAGETTAAAVYLLTPSAPDYASVLEERVALDR